MNYLERIPRPAASSVNTGLTYCKASTLESIFGEPSARKTVEHTPVTNPKLKKELETRTIPGFGKVTLLKKALDSLERIAAQVKNTKPELYILLSNAGGLNNRLIRGSRTTRSNHSWGSAIDVKIGGKLDTMGDGFCLMGLLELYPYFHREGWYWAVEFKREDGMHFEIADETIRKWYH